MRRNILGLLLVLTLLIFTGCDMTKQNFKGNDILKTKEFSELVTDEVYTLEIDYINLKYNGIKLEFIDGEESKVNIKTDENILETIKIDCNDNIIKITGNKKYRYEVEEFKIEVVNIKLGNLVLNGGFSITDSVGNFDSTLEINLNGAIDGDFNLSTVTDNLNVDINGVLNSDFTNLDLDVFQITVNGTINMDASGTVDSLEINVNGVTNLDCKDLTALVARINLDGTSNASLNVVNELNLDVDGIGNVDYYGDPTKTDISKEGLVHIIKK